MPFTSLVDHADLAKAQAALTLAIAKLEARGALDPSRIEAERQRLAAWIAGFAVVASDENDLADRAIRRFDQSV